jgi:hypothetical protein
MLSLYPNNAFNIRAVKKPVKIEINAIVIILFLLSYLSLS